MATTYKAWDETKQVPSKAFTGSSAVTYQEELIKTHAVGIDGNVQADQTVCGLSVQGTVTTRDFDSTPPSIRCGRCAEALDLLPQ